MTETMLALARELRCTFPNLTLRQTEPMAAHCSFRIGGPADLFAVPSFEEELSALRRFLFEKGVTPTVIGRGSNLLVRDGGIRGVVIQLSEDFASVRRSGDLLLAEAGISLARLAGFARDQGLAGLEFAHGIPGSLGGAVMMNAGAYGGEMKDVVVSVRYMNPQGFVGETEDPGFGYRQSCFTHGDALILGAALRLHPDAPADIGARMAQLSQKRSASQPLDLPSAGSTFKRPSGGYAAALIDQAGLRGYRVGGAQVSEKHCGFVVNTGGATAADVLALMAHIQETVQSRFGIALEPELRILGEDPA